MCLAAIAAPAVAQQPSYDELQERVRRLEEQVKLLTDQATGARSAPSTVEGGTLVSQPNLPTTIAAAPAEAKPRQPLPAVADFGVCRMANISDVNDAFLEPGKLRHCAAPKPDQPGQPVTAKSKRTPRKPAAGSIGQALAQAVDTPVPNRPLPTPGVSTTLEFGGDSSKATVTLAHPVILRSVAWSDESAPGKEFRSFRPQLLTISGGLNVPVSKGDRIFFRNEDRKNKSDIDILTGTTLKAGFDFLSFRKFRRDESIARASLYLAKAREQCKAAQDEATKKLVPSEETQLKAFGVEKKSNGDVLVQEPADPKATTLDTVCTGTDLIRYVLEYDPGKEAYTRAALAAEYQQTFWEEAKDAIPTVGAGFSVEYGSSDFTYQQGVLTPGPTANDPTRTQLNLDLTKARLPSATDTEDEWKIQGYLALFARTLSPDYKGQFTHRPYTQGIMFIASAAYLSTYQFRPGTSELTLCPAPQPGQAFVSCAPVNVDRPYEVAGINLSGEARMQFNNIPVLGVFGFAPKYTIRLEDSRNQLDVPFYLSATGGWGSAGIRLRHSWGGRDLLENQEKTKTDLSVFLSTPISFRKF